MIKAVAVLSLVGAALAQTSPISILGMNLSPQCAMTLETLATNSSFGNCTYISTLLPAVLNTNASAIPALDMLMSDVCYNQPCSNETLMNASSMITTGCATDLANSTYITNNTVMEIFELYPLIREVICLKTSQPYTNMSYNGTLGNPVIPITEYNSTGGYFCVSSVLTQLTAYFQQNFSLGFVEEFISGSNATAKMLVQDINPNILCNDCLFAAVDVIEAQFPMVGNASAQAIFGGLGVNASMMIPANATLNQVMDGECQYVPLMVSMNGTLPMNITETAVNSTFMYNVTMTNMTNSTTSSS